MWQKCSRPLGCVVFKCFFSCVIDKKTSLQNRQSGASVVTQVIVFKWSLYWSGWVNFFPHKLQHATCLRFLLRTLAPSLWFFSMCRFRWASRLYNLAQKVHSRLRPSFFIRWLLSDSVDDSSESNFRFSSISRLLSIVRNSTEASPVRVSIVFLSINNACSISSCFAVAVEWKS